MPKRSLEKETSRTALLAALYRAIGNKEFGSLEVGSDYLAERFLPFYAGWFIKSKKLRNKIRDEHRTKMPGIYEYVLARTAFFDRLFTDALAENVSQIVMLGAGYDTRAYRFADQNKGSRIFELDSAATQSRKKKRLKRAKIKLPEEVHYVSVDFNKESLKDALERAGCKNDRKTLFIWEGVCMYLEPESVDAILGFITHSSHQNSMIAFDYVITISDENRPHIYGAEEIFRIMQREQTKEPFTSTIDEDKVEDFFTQRGLNIIEHFDHAQIENTFLCKENGTSIGQPNGVFRFVAASPSAPGVS